MDIDSTKDDLTGGLFKILFEKSPGSVLVKADAPLFTIVAVSDDYLMVTSAKREDVIRFYKGDTNGRKDRRSRIPV
jgi:two-component system, OmpR family, sensor histidine kinase VicK